ncbi:hypothetical protein VB735_15050 [Halotia wernerae UHCC 0503]|nr:hypothetical protein [Halotia wernerae UHCC 0503]
MNHNWAIKAIARASVGLLLILINAEQLLITSQIQFGNNPDSYVKPAHTEQWRICQI